MDAPTFQPTPPAPTRIERVLPVLAFVAAAGLGAAFFHHARFFNDDSLITLRCATHLVEGKGLVYNPGEPVLGVTTPLWALLLASCVALGIDGPGAASVLGILATGWAGTAAVLLFRARGHDVRGQALAAALVATCPSLLTFAGAGMETPAYVAATLTFLWLFERGRHLAVGFAGGVVVLLRPDGGLVLAAAALVELVRSRSLRPLLRAAPGFAIVVLPWVVLGTLWYGSPLPNSGFAKRLQVEDWGTWFARLGEDLTFVGPLLAFAFVGFVAGIARPSRAGIAAPLAAIVLGMHFGGLPGCNWYTPPVLVLTALLAAEGAAVAAGALRPVAPDAQAPAGGAISGDARSRRVLAWAVLAAPLLGHAGLPVAVRQAKIVQTQVERCHGRVGTWLAEHAPRDASVGVDNIGYIGWRSGLRVVDMLGLVQSGTRERIAAGERDFALRKERPELIACWIGRGATHRYLPPQSWFDEQGYRVVFEAPLHDDRPRPAYTVFSRIPLPPR